MGADLLIVAQLPADWGGLPPLEPPLRLVALTGSGKETVEAAARWRPQALVVGIGPDQPPPGALISFLARQTKLPVVCLAKGLNLYTVRDALVAGAAQVLIWPDEAAELPARLLAVTGSAPEPADAPPALAIGLAGAKGGVGVTRLAAELALAFRLLGQPVLLVDAGCGPSGPLALLGLSAERSLGDLAGVADELTAEQVQKVAVSHPSGAVLVQAGPEPWTTESLATMVAACRRLFPVSIWDLPTGCAGLAGAAPFTHLLAVTTADAHAVQGLKGRLLPLWAGGTGLARARLVINRRTPDSLLRGPDIAAQITLPLAAEVDELAGLAAVSGTAATAITARAGRQPSRTASQIERLARSLHDEGHDGDGRAGR